MVFAKNPKVWDNKHFFPKNIKDYYLYVLDKCLLNGYKQASVTYHPIQKR